MPIREIAIAIVYDTERRYLLQRRDNIPGIVHPGKLSLFGGHRESGETYKECVVRELQEELGAPNVTSIARQIVTSRTCFGFAGYDLKKDIDVGCTV
jgi:8-oxo-dGTP pyrophosphatase MutT (NUDIX family)